MAAAPLPIRIIDKSLVSDGVIIDTVVNKYCDHSPLYRQSVALLRDAGVDIGRATMCGWVMTIGEMLMPVAETMRRHLLTGTYIQADETPVDVQTHDGSGTNHQGYLWQYRNARQGNDGFRFSHEPQARRPATRTSPVAASKDSCKPTPTLRTIAWAERRWCMRDVGRTREDTSWMRSN